MQKKSAPAFGVPVIDRFLAHCAVRRVPARTILISAGEASSSLFFLIEGSVAVLMEDQRGHEIVVAYLNRGEFFGELGLFQERPIRSAWVRTRGTCLIGEMGYAAFRTLAHQDPELLFAMAGQLAARLQHTTGKVRDLAFLDVTGRIARVLLDLCQEPDALSHPNGTQLRVSRQELGRLAGCSREMAGRVLKLLEEQGLVTAAGKTILVRGARSASEEVSPLSRRLRPSRRS